MLDAPDLATPEPLPPDDQIRSPIAGAADFLCKLGILAIGERKEIRFRVVSEPGLDYAAEARAGSNAADPDLTNNVTQAEIKVSDPQPDQAVAAAGSPTR